MASKHIKHLSDSNFKEGIASGVVLVDFYADWCGPCRMLAPVLDELAEEMAGKITVAKVDTDQAMQVASDNEITAIPTLLLFKNGKLMQRVSGLRDLEDLKAMVSAIL